MALSRTRALARALVIGSLTAIAALSPGPILAHDEDPADLGLDAIAVTAAAVDRTGLVTIAGEIACSQDLHDTSVWVDVTQVVGRLSSLSGSNGTSLDCLAEDGSASWSLSFYAYEGRFAPGKARLEAFAEVGFCTDEECFFDSVSTGTMEIRLRR